MKRIALLVAFVGLLVAGVGCRWVAIEPPAGPLPTPTASLPPPVPTETEIPTSVPTSTTAPFPTPTPLERRIIEIDLSDQWLRAYEDGELVLETPISTGTDAYPTPVGEYRIYLKLVADRMTGPGYDLPAVPWTMYFYGGYAIHGAYWHDQFGHVRSHGCINLPTMECPPGWTCPAQEFAGGRDIAKELFDWAGPVLPEGEAVVYASEDNPGTVVIIQP
jgi:hypothetical protein